MEKREIRFRGKSIETGEWVYGFVIQTTNTATIIPFNAPQGAADNYTKIRIDHIHPVIPESVGQYTGLKSKKGIEIYEGDIFEYELPGEVPEDETTIYTEAVVFTNGSFELDGPPLGAFNDMGKVIGNLYENPELTKPI